MPLSIRLQFVHALKALPLAQAEFNKLGINIVGDEVARQTAAGLSPVKGAQRFERYQPSYEDRIDAEGGIMKGSDGEFYTGKKKRPVNLSVSGKTLKTLEVKAKDDGFQVSYDSLIADYLNYGTSRMVARPMLPALIGQKFSNTITRLLNLNAQKSVDKILPRG